MHTLRLKINDKVYERLIWLLKKFNKDEVEIINEDAEFFENQKYLEKELEEITTSKANFIELEEVEKRLEDRIKRN